jgi:hypothetical protein
MAFSISTQQVAEADRSRRKIFGIVAVITLLIVAIIGYFVWNRPVNNQAPRLADALRPGSPEFEQARKNIVLEFVGDDSNDAVESPRPLGDIVMTLSPTVRNFTGRTITGLELRGVVLDPQGNVIKERTIVAIPDRQPELDNNKALKIPFTIEGFKKDDVRASVKVEITGLKLK